MTLTLFNRGMWIGSAPPGYDQSFNTSTTFMESGGTIDATGEKTAAIGRFWHPEHSTKSIRYIHWRAAAIVSAGGSAIDISLQNISGATNPVQPDETQDEKVSSVLLSALTASGWNTTAALSADRSTAIGDHIAVVWEFDGAGRLGADSLIVAGSRSAAYVNDGPTMMGKTGGTWSLSVVGACPIVIFECTDGTFGTLDESWPVKTVTTVSYNSGSSPNEYALEFTVPVEVSVDAAIVTMSIAGTTSDFDIVLYSGTTALATVSFDAHATRGTGTYGYMASFGSDVTLSPGTTYFLSLKPTTANNVSLAYFEVNATGHFDVHAGGQTWLMAHRAGGAWTQGWGSSLRRPKISLRVSKIHGSSSGGGYVIGG